MITFQKKYTYEVCGLNLLFLCPSKRLMQYYKYSSVQFSIISLLHIQGWRRLSRFRCHLIIKNGSKSRCYSANTVNIKSFKIAALVFDIFFSCNLTEQFNRIFNTRAAIFHYLTFTGLAKQHSNSLSFLFIWIYVK